MEISFQENCGENLVQVEYDSTKVHMYLCKTGDYMEQYSGCKCVCGAPEGSTC